MMCGAPSKDFTCNRPTHPQGLTGWGFQQLIPGLMEPSTVLRWESPTQAPNLEILPFSLKPACRIYTHISKFQLWLPVLKYPQLAAFWSDIRGLVKPHSMATT